MPRERSRRWKGFPDIDRITCSMRKLVVKPRWVLCVPRSRVGLVWQTGAVQLGFVSTVVRWPSKAVNAVAQLKSDRRPWKAIVPNNAVSLVLRQSLMVVEVPFLHSAKFCRSNHQFSLLFPILGHLKSSMVKYSFSLFRHRAFHFSLLYRTSQNSFQRLKIH